MPRESVPDDVYNTFKNFEAESKTTTSDIKFKDTLIMKHISTLCNHSQPMICYFLKYLANMLQQPYKLTNVSLIIKSKQGAGKDMFFNYFGNKILDSKYYTNDDSTELIFGKFNSELENKICIILNEADGRSTFEINSRIKNAITRLDVKIENKGMKAYTIKNRAAFIFLTNASNPVKIEDGDRRFCCIECDSSQANNANYFKDLSREMDSGIMDRLFYDYLMKLDITHMDFKAERPETELYRNMKSINIPLTGQFLTWMVGEDTHGKVISVGAMDLFEQFSDWMGRNKFKAEVNSTKFGIQLKDYSTITKKRTENGMKYIINIQNLKADLIKKKYYEVLDEFVDEEVAFKPIVAKNKISNIPCRFTLDIEEDL